MMLPSDPAASLTEVPHSTEIQHEHTKFSKQIQVKTPAMGFRALSFKCSQQDLKNLNRPF